jgi:hypothetical protein
MSSASLVAQFLLAMADGAPDCSFASTYPRQYVVHKLKSALKLDGKLDDLEWKEVNFTEPFVDIATDVVPRFETRVKMRYDDKFL